MGQAADFSVKFLTSGMPRVPKMRYAPGGQLAVLDALLVTGWGEITPLLINVADGIATCTCNNGDTFIEHCVIEVSGAEQPELNGQARVLSSTDTSFTFATDAPDGYATGAISVKAAAAGWERVFEGENKAVYRSGAPDASGALYRIDNSSNEAMIQGFVAMSDVDAGDFPFPVETTNRLCFVNGRDPVSFALFADPYSVIVSNTKYSATLLGASPMFFGALNPIDGGDMTLAHEAVCGMTSWGSQQKGLVSQSAGCFAATNNDGVVSGDNVAISFGALTAGTLNINAQEKLVLSRCLGMRSNCVFGIAPGCFASWQQSAANVIGSHNFLCAEINGQQRVLLSGLIGGESNPERVSGVFAVDITGPWR